MNNWKRVFATHEERQTLAASDWLGDKYPGVALPCSHALGRWIIIRYKDRWTPARVMDVGPWCTDDDEYVFVDGGRPRAEACKGELCPLRRGSPETNGKTSNGAGIDLFPETAKALAIPIGENVQLDWKFIEI